VMTIAIGIIYGSLFRVEIAVFVPFVMLGIIVWQMVSGIIIEGCQTFTAAQDVIQQVKLPFSIQAFRVVYRNLLILAHNAVIVPLAMVFFKMDPSWRMIEAAPGILLICFNGLWLSLFLGMASARFRDIPPIVGSIVQVLMFMTPIFWPLSAVNPARKHILAYNPFFAAVDIVRAPLLSMAPEPTSWPLMLCSTALITLCGFGLFARFRPRIAYWV
jgi:ABC-type polysaccharide/polyol phosphate export permease